MSEHRLEPLLPLLFPFFWAFVCVVIAYVGGWRSLAATYRAQQPFEGQRWWFQSGSMRWGTGYNNCLTVGASPLGLHLSVLFLFRAGHPPLFIPWEDVTVGSRRLLFMWNCRIEFRAVSGISLTIRRSLAEKLKVEAGQAWPLERVEPT